MKKLQDYLDCKSININTKMGDSYNGSPVNVDYAEDNDCNEDMITIETSDNGFFAFAESEIESIEILGEIEG